MKLIICEKPSLARNVYNALSKKYNDIYCIGAFGHLLGLKDIKDYEGMGKSWASFPIPFVPEKFEFKPVGYGSSKKQLNTIIKLIKDKKYTEIVHCGDADREGEVIVRLILAYSKTKKPITRLWLKDQTPKTILKAYDERKPLSDYDDLFNEGLARTFVDWLYGINYTVKMTLIRKDLPLKTIKKGSYSYKIKEPMKVGRVKTALLKEIYDRDKEIKEFVPQEKYRVVSDVDNIQLEAKEEQKDLTSATTYAKKLQGLGTYVKDKVVKRKAIGRPRLFSLSTLSNVMSKMGYTPDRTLKEVQGLYEQGYLTYPRTDSEYLTRNEIPFMKEVCAVQGDGKLVVKDNDYIFNNGKVNSHSAITPTTKKYNGNSKCYQVIMDRFWSHFYYKDILVDETTYKLECGDLEKWEVKGEMLIQEGYGKYNAKEIPNYEIGEKVKTDFKGEAYMTTPPPHYNVERINSFCKNPFKAEDEYDAIMKGIEIGTEATRPAILKDLVDDKLVNLNKSTYKITQKGIDYIKSFEKHDIPIITKEFTAKVSEKLKDVNDGKVSRDVLVKAVVKKLQEDLGRSDANEMH